ncbi:MAG: 23S rRNA (guanosine(2251)-2'-O)-methyltransferase RlmB [Candidatus Omnitrophota bacterium]
MSRNSIFLYGRNSVLERLKAQPESIKKIFLQNNFAAPEIEKLIKEKNVSAEYVPAEKLFRIKQGKDLQGIVAEAEQYNYASFYDLFNPAGAGLPASPKAPSSGPTLIFLDRINDPQNLGSIIRTAACLGNFAVVIPRHNACEVTETVLHVASGGENYVPVSLVPNITQAVIAAKKQGFWIMGAVLEKTAEDLTKVSLPFPLGLVLGAESGGIRFGVQKHLDFKVQIPMRGAALSFNVATACAIFCYEAARQRELTR